MGPQLNLFQQANSILCREEETVAVFKPRASRSVFARIVYIFLATTCNSAFEAPLVGKSMESVK